MLRRRLGVDDAARRPHDERRRQSRSRRTRCESAEVACAERTEVGVGSRCRCPLVLAKLRRDLVRRDDVCFREASSQLAGDRRLVGRVAEREQRADRYRVDVDVRQRVELERHEHPVRPYALAHAVAVPESNERLGMLGTQPVEVRAVLPAEMEQMLEAGRGDERCSGALALEQSIRRDRRPVREALDG